MSDRIMKFKKAVGLERPSRYVSDYFYASNMRSGAYLAGISTALEIWMILRLVRKIITGVVPMSSFWSVTEKYLANYVILLGYALLMLLYVMRFGKSRLRLRWLTAVSAASGAAVICFEVWWLYGHPPGSVLIRSTVNSVLLVLFGIVLIAFSALFLRDKRDRMRQSKLYLICFSFVCLNFGMYLSVNSYAKGEQILAFLTMALFILCLLSWRPWSGAIVLTLSYAAIYAEIRGIVPPNSPDGLPGITESTAINGFTMWLSTLLVCFANYRRILVQAKKDENLEKINAHLSEISVIDEMTGIHNMHYFRMETEKLLLFDTADRDALIYLFIDIENFKYYNEKYGFHDGNELLTHIARTINTVFRGSQAARFSDDHFVVLTPVTGCQEKVEAVAEELRKCQREVHLELKCGAYQPAADENDTILACDRARFACNSIKKHYGSLFRFYDQELEKQFRLKQYIVNHIDSAIENGHILVYYQPIVSAKTGHICGLEALARWNDPEYGLLPPGTFISVLEEYRQIYKLDRCIIELVCRDYREAVDRKLPFVPVSVNFSRLDFELCDIVGILTEAAEKYRVPREYLDVEITESALTDQKHFLPEAIQKLRGGGYKIWLDDFGSGYSSLNVLKDYQFDVMKIDMKFLSGFDSNKKTKPLLRNIIDLSKELSMISLTEGVETQAQYEFLQSIGCNRLQGYFFGKPAPLSVLRARIDAGEMQIDEQYH